MERFLFWRLFLVRAVFGFSGNDRLDFIFTVSCAQCPKTDKAFLPGAFDGGVLSSLDLIALLFQLLKKGFKVCGLLVQQDIVDYGTQLTLGFDTSMCRDTSTERTMPFFFWITNTASR